MWQTSKGILLKKTPYSDNKYILKIFTLHEGTGSYSVTVSESRKSASLRSVIGQPLPMIEFTYYNKASAEIRTLKSVHIDYPYKRIPHEMVRQAIAVFMNELILQTIKLPLQDEKMYSFLRQSLLFLDEETLHSANFPVWFAIRLALQLGIAPKNNKVEAGSTFDLISGKFVSDQGLPGVTLSEDLSSTLSYFMSAENPPGIVISKKDRMTMLNFMLDYLTFHADFQLRLKSADILSLIFQ
jgi:DNA repair protein RecO (recombination protein O)